MSPSTGGRDTKAFLEELKTNRKTQAATAVFVLVAAGCGWLLFAPDAAGRPTGRKGPTGAAAPPRTPVPPGTDALPDLGTLRASAALPSETAMRRDLFLFEGPRPAAAPVAPTSHPVDPAPQPEDPELVAARASAPRDLRYLGFLRGQPAGLLGAFMRGEEPLTLPPGALKDGWRLEDVQDRAATFRNQRFPALTVTLKAEGES